MAGMPINFAIPGEGVIASYNWTDMISKTGYIKYLWTVGSDKELLLTNAINPNLYIPVDKKGNVSKGGSWLGGNGKTFFDFSCETAEFKTPQFVRGTIYLSFYMQIDSSYKIKREIYLKKVDLAGTETTIASIVDDGNTFVMNGSFAFLWDMEATGTPINIGDKLKFVFKFTGDQTDYGYYRDLFFGIDPLNREVSVQAYGGTRTIPAGYSQFNITVPFKVEL